MSATHTLEWGLRVRERHPDAYQQWSRLDRKRVTRAMERGLAQARARWPGCTIVRDYSDCRQLDDGQWALYRCITLEEAS
jgi:hypothetical protein